MGHTSHFSIALYVFIHMEETPIGAERMTQRKDSILSFVWTSLLVLCSCQDLKDKTFTPKSFLAQLSSENPWSPECKEIYFVQMSFKIVNSLVKQCWKLQYNSNLLTPLSSIVPKVQNSPHNPNIFIFIFGLTYFDYSSPNRYILKVNVTTQGCQAPGASLVPTNISE